MLALFLVLLNASTINAIPIGNEYHGTVTINGTLAENVIVSVSVNCELLPNNVTTDSKGNYSALQATGEIGQVVLFYVDGQLASESDKISADPYDPMNPLVKKRLDLHVGQVKGDLNGNGKVDIEDGTMVAYMVIGKIPPDDRADFNGNGRVDIGDATKIAYYLAGKINTL